MAITSAYYGRTQSGDDVYQYTLENAHGMRVQVIEYGCVITNIWVPGTDGVAHDVVLGHADLAAYEADTGSYFGAFVGRTANRIEGAAFTLDGRTYTLEPNDGANYLHGVWTRRVFKGSVEDDRLVLRLHSPDGEDGFPGAVDVVVTYSLSDAGDLVLDYTATTDAPTLVNVTNHSYFNLNGDDGASAMDNTLQLAASRFTEGNAETCPTGRILPVEGTPFDFREAKPIGAQINDPCEQLTLAHGYDHNFVLDKEPGLLAKIGAAHSPHTGITMEVLTTQPGVQLYTANFIGEGNGLGKHGKPYSANYAFCLETQHFPCAPSHPDFPSIELRPEDEYHETTVYRFTTK